MSKRVSLEQSNLFPAAFSATWKNFDSTNVKENNDIEGQPLAATRICRIIGFAQGPTKALWESHVFSTTPP